MRSFTIPFRETPAAGIPRIRAASLMAAAILFLTTGCSSITSILPFTGQNQQDRHPHTVLLAYNEKAHRFTWLIKDMDMNWEILPREEVPFSAEASGAIWIGDSVPADKAASIIHLSRRYYPAIRYIAYTSTVFPEESDRSVNVYVGMPTKKALLLGLEPWDEKDLSSLKEIETSEQLKTLITSHSGKARKLPELQEERSFFLRILP